MSLEDRLMSFVDKLLALEDKLQNKPQIVQGALILMMLVSRVRSLNGPFVFVGPSNYVCFFCKHAYPHHMHDCLWHLAEKWEENVMKSAIERATSDADAPQA